jgi:hypothetical protein
MKILGPVESSQFSKISRWLASYNGALSLGNKIFISWVPVHRHMP